MITCEATGKWVIGTMDKPTDMIGRVAVPMEAQKGKINNLMTVDSVGSDNDLVPELRPGDKVFVRGYTDIPNTQQCYCREEEILGHFEETGNN